MAATPKGYERKEKKEKGEWKGPIRAHYPHGHWRNHQKWRLHQPGPGPKPKPKEMPKPKKVEDIRGWKWEEDKGWVKDPQGHAKQTESGKGSGVQEAPQKAEWEYKEKKNEWKELPAVVEASGSASPGQVVEVAAPGYASVFFPLWTSGVFPITAAAGHVS